MLEQIIVLFNMCRAAAAIGSAIFGKGSDNPDGKVNLELGKINWPKWVGVPFHTSLAVSVRSQLCLRGELSAGVLLEPL